MALITCPECGKVFSDKAPACPNCGCPIEEILYGGEEESWDSDPTLDALFRKYPRDQIRVIKEYTAQTGCSLSEAKVIVDAYLQSKRGEKETFSGYKYQQPVAAYQTPAGKKGGLACPHCGSHNIDLWSNQANMKEFQRTGLNLNPLHPLTPFKTKTVKKEKKSAAKIGLGLMTGGTSLLLTGTNKKAHNEYYCRDCGNKWVGK